MEVGFDQLMQIMVLAVVVLLFYWQHKSFPPDETSKLILELRKASEKTDTKIDDALVDLAEFLNGLRRDSEPTVLGDDKGELSV
jgi:hypothetical protein